MPTTSPNMMLPIPIVGVDTGPAWATFIDNCLNLIDSHDHSTGKGVPISVAGMNINADLNFNGFNDFGLRSTRFNSQVSPLSLPADVGCLYVSGVDLYFNDENGVQVRMTQNGAIVGTPGSISGLVAPASASYSVATKTFIWQSNTNTSANLDAASITIRQILANANGITISSPNSLAANYTLTLPTALPGSGTQILAVNNAGNMTFVNSGTIVGTGGSYATINAAIAATSPGGYITVLPGTYTESIVLTKNLSIVGQGFGTILNGTLEFATGSDESSWIGFKNLGNVTIDAGVNGIWMTEFWLATAAKITNNGVGPYVRGIQL